MIKTLLATMLLTVGTGCTASHTAHSSYDDICQQFQPLPIEQRIPEHLTYRAEQRAMHGDNWTPSTDSECELWYGQPIDLTPTH